MNEVLKAIEKRSSTRGYLQEGLTEEEQNLIIKAGLQAPTANNRREIHISVVEGNNPVLAELDEEKNRLRGIGIQPHNFYYEAPVVFFISAESAFGWNSLDAGIAVENMALAAESLGLGSLIIGCIKDAMLGEKGAYFAQKLQIPEGWEYKIALAAGHKAMGKMPHEIDMEKAVSFIK